MQYIVCDYLLNSEIEFPELRISKHKNTKVIHLAQADLRKQFREAKLYHTWINADRQPWLKLYKLEKHFFIEYPDCLFCINLEENLISYQILNNLEQESLRHFFLDQIIPLFLSAKDYLVLHASAVVIDNYSFILTGESGSGKSTLAQELGERNIFISDDFIPLKNLNIIPTYPTVRLWQDTTKKIKHVVSDDNFSYQVQTPSIILSLTKNNDFEVGDYKLTSCDKQLMFQKIMNNLFILETESEARQIFVFKEVNSLLESINTFQLEFSNLINNSSKLENELKLINGKL